MKEIILILLSLFLVSCGSGEKLEENKNPGATLGAESTSLDGGGEPITQEGARY